MTSPAIATTDVLMSVTAVRTSRTTVEVSFDLARQAGTVMAFKFSHISPMVIRTIFYYGMLQTRKTTVNLVHS